LDVFAQVQYLIEGAGCTCLSSSVHPSMSGITQKVVNEFLWNFWEGRPGSRSN